MQGISAPTLQWFCNALIYSTVVSHVDRVQTYSRAHTILSCPIWTIAACWLQCRMAAVPVLLIHPVCHTLQSSPHPVVTITVEGV